MFAGVPAAIQDRTDSMPADTRSRASLIRAATFADATSSHAGTLAAPVADTAAGGAPSNSAVVEDPKTDWGGLWTDTGILFGTQVVAAGIIYSMPQSVSNWSDEQKKNSFNKYFDNLFNPVVDKDEHYINYALHPYWGATYYIRGRERGLEKLPAFVYSALISAMYEFGVECFFEKPSIQDLVVTPVVGTFLGALVFEPWRESIKRKPELRWYDHAVLAATDPVGVLSLAIESLFGVKSTIVVDYSSPQLQRRSAGTALASRSNRFGVVVQFPLN